MPQVAHMSLGFLCVGSVAPSVGGTPVETGMPVSTYAFKKFLIGEIDNGKPFH